MMIILHVMTIKCLVGPAHKVLVIIAYAQMPIINAHADVYRGARGLTFGLSLHLYPYFVYVGSEGSDKSVYVHKLT